MKFRTTLILIAVMIGLFLYMYRFEIVREREEKAAEELANMVMPFEVDSVTTLMVRSGDENVVCRKTDTGWEVDEPVRTKGDESVIEAVIGSVTALSIERVLVEEPDDMAHFGLADPTVAIHLAGEDFSSDTLFLGAKNPTKTYAYARTSGSPRVFLLPQVTISQCEKSLFDLRDKRILDIDQEEVRKFSIESENGTVTCERTGDEWYITNPLHDRAERGPVNRVLSSVANGKAAGFEAEVAGDLRKYGLDDPRVTIDVFTGADMTRHRIIVGEQETRRYYAKVESRDPILELTNIFYEAVTQEPSEFRFKKVLDVDRNEITTMEIVREQGSIFCEQDSTGTWFVMKSTGPERQPAKEGKINQLLSALVTLRVEEFVEDDPADLSQYGLDDPVLRIIALGPDGEIGSMSFGGDSEDKVYAISTDRDTVVLVRRRSVDNIDVDFEDLKGENTGAEGSETTE